MAPKAVKGYEGARYPTLGEHLRGKSSRALSRALTVAAAVAALASLLVGCRSIS